VGSEATPFPLFPQECAVVAIVEEAGLGSGAGLEVCEKSRFRTPARAVRRLLRCHNPFPSV
jgi:hypothetical protein